MAYRADSVPPMRREDDGLSARDAATPRHSPLRATASSVEYQSGTKRDTAPRGERRGARHPALVPDETRQLLEQGDIQTANFMEQIAIDMVSLWANSVSVRLTPGDKRALRDPRLVTRMQAGACLLWRHFGHDIWQESSCWTSDTMRGWAAMAVREVPESSLSARLRLASPYADDHHFSVREWAWIGPRPFVASQPLQAITELTAWTTSDSWRIRRFCSEATRPIGVWGCHAPLLKRQPSLALTLLEHLRGDAAEPVRKSVSNWLCDAARSDEAWVVTLCKEWQATTEESAEFTHDIVRRVTVRLRRRGKTSPRLL
jgi:3-methyladenine DNA glycosylase AlkC